MKMQNEPFKRLLPFIMGGITTIIYLATGCRGIDPIVSASQIAQHLHLTPFPPLSHPIWGALIRGLTALSPFGIATTLNTTNALFMGMSAGILSHIMVQWDWSLVPEKYRMPKHQGPASILAAITAPLLFTITLPVWVAGTRTTPLAFDCLLLSAALLLVWRFYKSPSPIGLFTLAFVWGAGITEYSSFIVLSPIVLFTLVVLVWQAQLLNLRNIFIFALLFLAGLSIYAMMAWGYCDTPAYGWREFKGIHEVFWQLFRQQYLDLRNATVSLGWILILILLIVPWLAIVIMPLSDQRRTRYYFYSYMLFFVFFVITLVVLLNVPPAPWHFTRMFPLIVFPYLLFASWAGRLAGTAYLILRSPDTFRRPLHAGVKKTLLVISPFLAATLIIVAAVRNYSIVNPRGTDQVHQLAEQVASHLEGRTRLLSNGFLDNNVLIAAHEQHQDVSIINLGLGLSRGYRRYVGSLFSDPRLRNLATIGWQPLLEEWPKRDPNITEVLAIIQPVDLWSRLNFTSVPAPLLYMGFNKESSISTQTIETATAFWQEYAARWTNSVDQQNIGAPWYNAAKQLVSQLNNNLGICAQNKNLNTHASDLYQTAYRVDSNNLCAVMNLLALQNMEADPAAEETDRLLTQMIEGQNQRMAFWQLSARYGYIRDPSAYIAQGYAWAISGKPSVAIRDVERAIELSGETPAMKLLLANLYVTSDKDSAGAGVYADLLDSDPENVNALIGMARLALRQNNIAMAQDYLTRLQKTGVDMTAPSIEGLVISMAVQTDNYTDIRALLKNMLKKEPEKPRLWATLALLASQNGDDKTASEARQALGSSVNANPKLGIVIAQLEIKEGNYEEACNYLRGVLKQMPGEVPVHEQYLQLLVDLRRRDDAEEQAITILGIDPNNAVANYVIGSIQNSRGEEALAENSFRACLSVKRNPAALNDLAWLLAQKGEFTEALPLVQEALALRPDDPNTLDTACLIQLNLGMLQDAETSIIKALSFYPKSATMQFHHALLLEKKGDYVQCLQIADPLINRMHELSDANYAELRELIARLRKYL